MAAPEQERGREESNYPIFSTVSKMEYRALHLGSEPGEAIGGLLFTLRPPELRRH